MNFMQGFFNRIIAIVGFIIPYKRLCYLIDNLSEEEFEKKVTILENSKESPRWRTRVACVN